MSNRSKMSADYDVHDLMGRAFRCMGKAIPTTEEEVLAAESEIDSDVDALPSTLADPPRIPNAREPLRLRIDEQDLESLSQLAPYSVYELKYCATEVIRSPTVVFQGLRSEGELTAGMAFSGRPHAAFDNFGIPIPPPRDMVYLVFACSDGFIFDWDWVSEDPVLPGYPERWRERFGECITVSDAVIDGIEQVSHGRDEGKVCACGEPYHPTPIGDVCLVCGSRPPMPDITELLALCSKATCEHDLDDGRCLLCGFDLEYTPSS